MLVSAKTFSDNFPIVPLGKAVEFLDNLRKPVTASDRTAGEYPYYGANGLQGTINDYIFDEPLVLLAEDGGFFGMPDKTIAYQVSGKCWVNNHAHVLRPKQGVDIRYLLNVLQKYDVTPYTNGTTRAKLTKGSAERIPIPLPPLEEQMRIAAILDKTDAIRRKRAESLKLLDELLRATFLDMFGTSENKGWNETTVGKITGDQSGAIRTGPFGSQLLHSEFVDEGIAVLGIDNAVHNEFRWAKPRFISPEKYRQLKRYTVRHGDVLITIMGTCGRCAIVPDNCPPAINTKHLCCITLNQQICLPEFLHSFFLMHPKARYYLKQTAKGAIMDGLNMAIIKAMPIVLPPIGLQKKYSDFWHKIQESKQQFCGHAAESDTLFHSLVARAFKGEL